MSHSINVGVISEESDESGAEICRNCSAQAEIAASVSSSNINQGWVKAGRAGLKSQGETRRHLSTEGVKHPMKQCLGSSRLRGVRNLH